MIEKTNRGINDREFSEIASQILKIRKYIKLLILSIIGCIAFEGFFLIYVEYMYKYYWYDLDNKYPIISLVTFIMLIISCFLLTKLVSNKRARRYWADVQNNNNALTIEIRPVKIIKLCEYEDLGEYYLFEGANQSLICIGGQDYSDYKKLLNEHFKFDVVFDSKNGIASQYYTVLGKKIKPTQTIKGKEVLRIITSNLFFHVENFEVKNITADKFLAKI